MHTTLKSAHVCAVDLRAVRQLLLGQALPKPTFPKICGENLANNAMASLTYVSSSHG